MASNAPLEAGTCKVTGCERTIKSPGHQECPLHSQCYTEGRFIPQRCEHCSEIWKELELAKGDVQLCPNFGQLGDTLQHLMEDASKEGLPRIRVTDIRIPLWYPGLFPNGDAVQEEIPKDFQSLRSIVKEIMREVSSSYPRDSSRSPSTKRSRLSSRASSINLTSPMVSPAIITEVPLIDKGWQEVQSNWVICSDDNKLTALEKTGEGLWETIQNIEIRAHHCQEGTCYYFRSQSPESTPSSGYSEQARNHPLLLTSLAARLQVSKTDKPDINLERTEKGHMRVTVEGTEFSSLLKLDTLELLGTQSGWSQIQGQGNLQNRPTPYRVQMA